MIRPISLLPVNSGIIFHAHIADKPRPPIFVNGYGTEGQNLGATLVEHVNNYNSTHPGDKLTVSFFGGKFTVKGSGNGLEQKALQEIILLINNDPNNRYYGLRLDDAQDPTGDPSISIVLKDSENTPRTQLRGSQQFINQYADALQRYTPERLETEQSRGELAYLQTQAIFGRFLPEKIQQEGFRETLQADLKGDFIDVGIKISKYILGQIKDMSPASVKDFLIGLIKDVNAVSTLAMTTFSGNDQISEKWNRSEILGLAEDLKVFDLALELALFHYSYPDSTGSSTGPLRKGLPKELSYPDMLRDAGYMVNTLPWQDIKKYDLTWAQLKGTKPSELTAYRPEELRDFPYFIKITPNALEPSGSVVRAMSQVGFSVSLVNSVEIDLASHPSMTARGTVNEDTAQPVAVVNRENVYAHADSTGADREMSLDLVVANEVFSVLFKQKYGSDVAFDNSKLPYKIVISEKNTASDYHLASEFGSNAASSSISDKAALDIMKNDFVYKQEYGYELSRKYTQAFLTQSGFTKDDLVLLNKATRDNFGSIFNQVATRHGYNTKDLLTRYSEFMVEEYNKFSQLLSTPMG